MNRVCARGRGSVFTASDFSELADCSVVEQTLSRLVDEGRLRRLAPGVYDFPKLHARLGALSPVPDEVAQALAREHGAQIQIDGARSAYALGLTTQVPAQSGYLTDGPSRRVKIGQRVITLTHTSSSNLIAPGTPAGTVFQALLHAGADRSGDVVRAAAGRLTTRDREALAAASAVAPSWMRPALEAIATGDLARVS